MIAEPIEIAGRRGEQARHQVACIASTRSGAQHSRFRQQIFELKKELRGIVSRSVEGKGLWENSLEGTRFGRGFEANFASMKSKGESKGELKSFDAQL